MSEDQRVSNDTQEPSKTGRPGAERWVAYLAWLREDLIGGVLSLPPEEQRRSRVPSGWSPIDLLSHVLHMEQRWFVWGFLGEAVAEPWGDWDVPDPSASPDARWAVDDRVTAEELAARLRAIGESTRSVLREHPLDARGRPGGRFADNPPTLEWICFHVLAEYARHAGHYDIVAELSS